MSAVVKAHLSLECIAATCGCKFSNVASTSTMSSINAMIGNLLLDTVPVFTRQASKKVTDMVWELFDPELR